MKSFIILSALFLFLSGCQKNDLPKAPNSDVSGSNTAAILPPSPGLPIDPTLSPWFNRPDSAPEKAERLGNSDVPFNPCPGTDNDLDGFGSSCDCDDNNPRVQPGFACLTDVFLGICQVKLCSPDLTGVCELRNTPQGTLCGSVLNGPCDALDHCDETGNCIDEKNGAETVCRDAVGVCNTEEVCDGVNNACPADTYAPVGTPCGINNQGACLDTGACDAVNPCPIAPPGNPDSDGDNYLDACDCDPNNAAIHAGTSCTSDGLECTIDICDPSGNSAECLHKIQQIGQACGNPALDLCDLQDTCVGDGSCKDNVAPAEELCRIRVHSCDREERCDGINKTCPENNLASPGTLCGFGLEGACDEPDRCDELGNCLREQKPLGTECRASQGECDAAEFCDGISGSCPVDMGLPDGTLCGTTPSGACDAQNTCDNFLCVNNVLPDGTLCRSTDSPECDPAEFCDGVSQECPPNSFVAFGNTETPCLAGSGLGLTISAECLGDNGTIICIEGEDLCYPTNEAQCFDQSISRDDAGMGANSALGASVSVDGRFAVAGAPGANESDQGFNSGNIIKLDLSDQNQWSIRVVLGIPTQDSGNSSVKDFILAQNTLFGKSVDNIGSFSLTGAPGANYNTNSLGTKNSAGAVFTHVGSSLDESIISTAPEDGANFGTDVSFDGTWAIVGEPEANNTFRLNGSGAVEFYSYIPSSMKLSFEQRVIPSDNQSDDHFGEAVALFGEWALAGAPEDDVNGVDDAGSVYFYKYDPGSNRWLQTQKISSPVIGDGNNFGESVAIYNDVAVIGEPRDDFNGFDDLGRVHIYRLSGNTWVYEQTLLPSIQDENVAFGWSVAIQDNVIVVGQPGDIENLIGTKKDVVYIYTYNGTWQPYGQPIFGDGLENSSDGFGTDVDIKGDWIIIGAPFSFTGEAVWFYFFPYDAISTPI